MTYYPEYRFFGAGVNDSEAEEILNENWAVTCKCDDTEQIVNMPVATVCYASHDTEGNDPYYCGTWTCPRCGEIHKDDEDIRPEDY